MNNLLLYISSLLIILAYVIYFFISLFNNKKIEDTSGFDIANDILEEYDGIKIILSKGLSTYYDIKRKIIKMSKKNYYGNKVSDLTESLLEVGTFVYDKKGSKIIDIFRKIMPTLKILYILPIISIVINFSTYSVNDSRISLIILFIFFLINYFLLTVKNDTYNLFLEKQNSFKDKILKNISMFIKLDYGILFGYTLMMFRFFLILFGVNI